MSSAVGSLIPPDLVAAATLGFTDANLVRHTFATTVGIESSVSSDRIPQFCP